MIGITIGMGADWRQAAARAAALMQGFTGVRCVVVDELGSSVPPEKLPKVEHPSWLKAHLLDLFPEENDFLVFDADIVPQRMWSPAEIFFTLNRAFCAVPDRNTEAIRLECAAFGLPYPDWYVNGGLLMFGREHAPVWDYVKGKHPKYGRWLEQTALNEALHKLDVPVARLPNWFNHIGSLKTTPPPGVINLHPAGEAITLADLKNSECGGRADNSLSAGVAEQCSALPSGEDFVVFHEQPRQELLRRLPPHSVGAELGVFRGDFSSEILATVNPTELHLVDLFAGCVMSGDADGLGAEMENMADMPRKLSNRFPGAPLKIHKSSSVDWLKAQPPNSLDWVYIDSDHTRLFTKLELQAAQRAVRPGGIIAGHDFNSEIFPGVVDSVNEFVSSNGLKLQVFAAEKYPSYFIINEKPARPAGLPPRQKKLMLGVPIYGGVDAHFMNSLIELLALKRPCPMVFRDHIGDSLVSRARNAITMDFLDSDCTHLLFIDSDLVFSPEHVARLMEHDEAIVAGIYPKKNEGDLHWVLNADEKHLTPRADGLQQVRYAGTGFLRVAREVFEQMVWELGDRIRYTPDHKSLTQQGWSRCSEYDFWSVGTHEFPDGYRRYLSEDWYFCQRALDLGFKVWVDTHVVLKHVGQAIYPLKSQESQITNPK